MSDGQSDVVVAAEIQLRREALREALRGSKTDIETWARDLKSLEIALPIKVDLTNARAELERFRAEAMASPITIPVQLGMPNGGPGTASMVAGPGGSASMAAQAAAQSYFGASMFGGAAGVRQQYASYLARTAPGIPSEAELMADVPLDPVAEARARFRATAGTAAGAAAGGGGFGGAFRGMMLAHMMIQGAEGAETSIYDRLEESRRMNTSGDPIQKAKAEAAMLKGERHLFMGIPSFIRDVGELASGNRSTAGTIEDLETAVKADEKIQKRQHTITELRQRATRDADEITALSTTGFARQQAEIQGRLNERMLGIKTDFDTLFQAGIAPHAQIEAQRQGAVAAAVRVAQRQGGAVARRAELEGEFQVTSRDALAASLAGDPDKAARLGLEEHIGRQYESERAKGREFGSYFQQFQAPLMRQQLIDEQKRRRGLEAAESDDRVAGIGFDVSNAQLRAGGRDQEANAAEFSRALDQKVKKLRELAEATSDATKRQQLFTEAETQEAANPQLIQARQLQIDHLNHVSELVTANSAIMSDFARRSADTNLQINEAERSGRPGMADALRQVLFTEHMRHDIDVAGIAGSAADTRLAAGRQYAPLVDQRPHHFSSRGSMLAGVRFGPALPSPLTASVFAEDRRTQELLKLNEGDLAKQNAIRDQAIEEAQSRYDQLRPQALHRNEDARRAMEGESQRIKNLRHEYMHQDLHLPDHRAVDDAMNPGGHAGAAGIGGGNAEKIVGLLEQIKDYLQPVSDKVQNSQNIGVVGY